MKKQYLSSFTLFNFTKEWNYFEDKIKNGFSPRFVLEDFSYFNFNAKFAFPMVCFCDIVMSQLKDHIEEYGKYGIGLTKEWGKRQGLNPILYVSSKDSSLLKHLKTSRSKVEKIKFCNSCKNKENFTDLNHSMISILRYLKPINGTQNKKERIFYDEKEWRYLLNDDKLFFIDEKTFNDLVLREEKNEKIQYKLKFTAEDIRYLIIKDKSEVEKLLKLLKKIYPKEHNYLATRIIITTDIEMDF